MYASEDGLDEEAEDSAAGAFLGGMLKLHLEAYNCGVTQCQVPSGAMPSVVKNVV